MEENNKKYITLSFVGAGAIAYYVTTVLLNTLARTWGAIAQYLDSDLVAHGVPVAVAFVTFFYLQFNKKIVAWADEVIVEVLKVVWPSRKDTFSMTIVVTIMLILSGVILGSFDYVSHLLVSLVLG